MYDTIDIKLPLKSFEEVRKVEASITVFDQTQSLKKGIKTYGSIRNMKTNLHVNCRENRKTLYLKGSASKYLLGNNIESISFSQIPEFIDSLETELGISLTNASTTRIDFGFSIETNKKPCLYLSELSNIKGWSRFPYKESSMSFENSMRWESNRPGSPILRMYDKGLESNLSIPNHLLKIETSKRSYLPLISLHNKQFAKEQLITLKSLFNRLEKLKRTNLIMNPQMTSKQFLDRINQISIVERFGSLILAESWLKSQYDQGCFSNQKAYFDTLQKIRKAFKSVEPKKPNLMEELTNKIESRQVE